MSSLGHLARTIRGRRGLALREVARRAGVDAGWLSRLEQGAVAPPSDRWGRSLARLADAMELSAEERDGLYLASGLAPPWLGETLLSDAAFRDVVRVLTDPRVPDEARQRFREAVVAMAALCAPR